MQNNGRTLEEQDRAKPDDSDRSQIGWEHACNS
jgi:hypothetical protein